MTLLYLYIFLFSISLHIKKSEEDSQILSFSSSWLVFTFLFHLESIFINGLRSETEWIFIQITNQLPQLYLLNIFFPLPTDLLCFLYHPWSVTGLLASLLGIIFKRRWDSDYETEKKKKGIYIHQPYSILSLP